MRVKPLKDHLLIKMIDKEEVTQSGILLAGSTKGDTNLAEIKEIAEDINENEVIFRIGDKILIKPGAGTKVELEGRDYLVINKMDILAILCG